jgi:hypothetical protein
MAKIKSAEACEHWFCNECNGLHVELFLKEDDKHPFARAVLYPETVREMADCVRENQNQRARPLPSAVIQ